MIRRKTFIAFAAFALCLLFSSCVREKGFEDRVTEIAKTNELSTRIATVAEQTVQLTSSVATLTAEHQKLQDYTAELSARVAEIEVDISTVDARIAAVRTEMKDSLDKQKTVLIGMLDAYKDEMKITITNLNTQIENLRNKDAELVKKIEDLQKYVNDTLKGTQDWARATFSTLAQKDSLARVTAAIEVYTDDVNARVDSLAKVHSDDTATIFAAIRALDTKSAKALEKAVKDLNSTIEATASKIRSDYTAAIKSAVDSTANSVRKWVNDTLNHYYTVSQVDAMIQVTRKSIDSLSGKTLAAENRITSLETMSAGHTSAIKNLRDSLKTAYNNIAVVRDSLKILDAKIAGTKTEITAAYKSAISDSLGQLRLVMTDSLKNVNARVSALAGRMTAVEGRVTTLEGRMTTVRDSVQTLQAEIAGLRTDVDRLISRIQSIEVVPEYRDGSVGIMKSGTVTVSFEVRPASLADAIAKKKGAGVFFLQAVETKAVTKTVTYCDLAVTSPTVGSDSLLTLTVGRGGLPDEFFAETKCFNARLRISDGNIDKTSAYFPLTPAVEHYSFDKDTVSVTQGSTATVTLLLGTAAVPDAKTSDFTFSGTTKGLTVTNVTTAGLVTLTATDAATATADAKLQYKKNGTGAVLAEVPVKVIPPVFSVSATTKVRFSKGNLYYNGKSWEIEANQYDYRTIENKNSCIGGTISDNGTPTGNWGAFGWSTDGGTTPPATYKPWGINTSTSSADYPGNFKDWGIAYCQSKGITSTNTWRTLSSVEWSYLLNTDGSSGRTDANRFAKANVKGVKGLLIFPDGYTGTTSGTGIAAVNTTDAAYPTSSIPDATWKSMESAGCVFLPAAGCRNGSDVSKVGDNGNYWSSTAFAANSAYALYFDGNIIPAGNYFRRIGHSVRLVTDVK